VHLEDKFRAAFIVRSCLPGARGVPDQQRLEIVNKSWRFWRVLTGS